jgi:hypothetical protein
MSIQSFQAPFELELNRDSNGNPITVLIYNEPHVVYDSQVLLAQLPSESAKVVITGMYEQKINTELGNATEFKVDYGSSIVYFHPDLEGTSVNISVYAGRGIKYLYAQRVKLEDLDNLFTSIHVEGGMKELVQRLNFLLANTQQASEVVDARVDANTGTEYEILGQRLNAEYGETYNARTNDIPALPVVYDNLKDRLDTEYQYFDNEIGILSNLTTTEKSNLVGAVSEVKNEVTSHLAETAKYYTPEMYGGTDWIHCQKAVDAACVDGGVVIFRAGVTYTINSNTLVVWGSNVTIIAYGAKFNYTGTPGNYGGCILVIGKVVGIEYYGYLNGNNYTTRVAYAGTPAKSVNVHVFGFEDVTFDASLDGTAMNGLAVGNCEKVTINDCYINNVPQTSYAIVATGSEEIEVELRNCHSIGARGHAFRAITSTVDANTRLTAKFINCTAKGTTGVNQSAFAELLDYVVDLYLRGSGIGDRFNIVTENCNFEAGVFHPNCGGVVKNTNLKCKWYYRKTSSAAADTDYKADYNEDLETTGNVTVSAIDYSVYFFNTGGNVVVKGLKHPNGADTSKFAFAARSPKNLYLFGVDEGNIQLSMDATSYPCKAVIEKCKIKHTGNLTMSFSVAESQIILKDNDIDVTTYITGNALTTYRLIDNKITRRGSSSGYGLIRNMTIGNAKNNEMYLITPTPDSEPIVIEGDLITQFHNQIIQTDGTRIVDYGGISTGVPTTGYRRKRQFVYETNPVAGGYTGYECITSGASGGTWKGYGQIDLQGSITWNPASLADGVGETSSAITVTGASLGDFVLVSAPYDLQGITCNGYVSGTDTIKIRIQNETGGVIDLASGTCKVKVIKA